MDRDGIKSDASVKASATTPEALGWDFECHTYTHPHLTGLNDSQIREELEQVNTAFQAHGLPLPEHHAYPYGDINARVKSIVAEYRKSGRLAGGNMETYPVQDWYGLPAIPLKSSTSFNSLKGWIDQCIASKALLHIFTHDVKENPSEWGTTPAVLTQLLDYLVDKQDAGQLMVMTMKEAYDYWTKATEGRATVVVSFDDGWKTDYTTVWPLFRERGLKGTSYIFPSVIGMSDHLTWAMIEEMVAVPEGPAAPAGLTAKAVNSSQINLDWNNNTEVDLAKYNVYRSTTSGFTPGSSTFVANVNVSDYSDTGLNASTTYYYKVTAVDTGGLESDPSAEANATTQAPPSSGITLILALSTASAAVAAAIAILYRRKRKA